MTRPTATGARALRPRWMPVVGALTLFTLGGCAPALNWREIALEASGQRVLLPCKPQIDARSVALLGATLPMRLAACSAGGHTWAVAELRLPPGLNATAVQQALRQAAARNLGASDAALVAAPAPAHWRVAGQRQGGQPAVLEMSLAMHGRVIVQLSAIGSMPATAEARESFFGALRMRP